VYPDFDPPVALYFPEKAVSGPMYPGCPYCVIPLAAGRVVAYFAFILSFYLIFPLYEDKPL